MRALMRHVAQPVAVVTSTSAASSPSARARAGTASGQLLLGATLSSLSSISLSPPLISFALRLPSSLASALKEHSSSSSASKLTVHLLSASSEARKLASAFARSDPSAPRPTADALERLDLASLGRLECSVARSISLAELDEASPASEHDSEQSGEKTEAPSELFIARVLSVDFPATGPSDAPARETEDERVQQWLRELGSLVYIDHGFKDVK